MEINPSVWAFVGVIGTALLSYLSTRKKYRSEGASALVDAGVALVEQYRIANEECRKELEKCEKRTKSK